MLKRKLRSIAHHKLTPHFIKRILRKFLNIEGKHVTLSLKYHNGEEDFLLEMTIPEHHLLKIPDILDWEFEEMKATLVNLMKDE